MKKETIGDFLFQFESKGKYACIKEITRVNSSDRSIINTLVIPSKVHFNGVIYEVNALSGRLIKKEYYRPVTTDRRRKDYGKTVPTGIYETYTNHVLDLYSIHMSLFDGEIILPETIREIGPYTFCDREYIHIKLNNGLKVIRKEAFEKIKETKIDIPYSVKIIEEGAFSSCDGLCLIVDNEPGAIKGIEKCGIYKDNIIFLRPKTSWFSRLIKRIIPNH